MPQRGGLACTPEFGPFDLLADRAHRAYVAGDLEQAVRACRGALLVVQPAGDVETARYLRYVEGVALQESGSHRDAVTVAMDLVAELDGAADPCWRAKSLALLAESSASAGELTRAVDSLAEAVSLLERAPSGSYLHVSAAMAVAIALRQVHLFEQADELMPRAGRWGPAVDVLLLHEGATLQAQWAASLQLIGRHAEAERHLAECARRAVRMHALTEALGEPGMAARAEVLEAYAVAGLGDVELAAARVRPAMRRLGRRRRRLLEQQLAGLVVGQACAARGEYALARRCLLDAVEDAETTGRDVWAGTLLKALADVDVAEHGRHPAIGAWKRLGREVLLRLWQEREARFAALAHRTRLRELAEEHQRTGREALMDPLTGLGNRRMLSETVARAGGALSVVFVDVDLFKAVNDTYSHAVGDQVLMRLAAILRQHCRPEDVVIRYGGDEFVVLVLDGPGVCVVEDIAHRLRDAVRAAPWDDLADGLAVTVSVGVSSSADAAAAVASADTALYAAKRGGRDRVVTA